MELYDRLQIARIYFNTDSGSSFQIFLVACLMQIIEIKTFATVLKNETFSSRLRTLSHCTVIIFKRSDPPPRLIHK